jgi:hypothetical protein
MDGRTYYPAKSTATRKTATAKRVEANKKQRAAKRKRVQTERRAKNRNKVKQHRQRQENVDFEMGAKKLDELVQDWEKNPGNCNISKSLIHSLIVYYLNSGHDRFGEVNQYASKLEGKLIDKTSIIDEIQSQQLNGSQLYKIIENFVSQHNFGAMLYCCGACGIREYL